MTQDEIEKIILNWVGHNYGSQEMDDPSWNVKALARTLADNLPMPKLYEAEFQAHQFMKGWHSLKEWAGYGFNKIVFEGREFWDGLENGCDDFEDIDDLEMSYLDFDDDNYMFIGLERGKK